MNRKGLFALTLVGTMALSSATPVFADTATVGFSKAAPNTAYTMTVPTGSTSVATDGTFSSIGELKVESEAAFDTGSKVEVTVARSTVMTNTNANITTNNTITYDLYTGTSKVDENKVADGAKIEFSASQIDAKTPVAMGVAISGSNYNDLEPGDYRDTITFTADVKDEATGPLADIFKEGSVVSYKFTEPGYLDPPREGSKFIISYKYTSGKFVLQSIKNPSGREYGTPYTNNATLTNEDGTLIFRFYGNDIRIDTNNNEYAVLTNYYSDQTPSTFDGFTINGEEYLDKMTEKKD